MAGKCRSEDLDLVADQKDDETHSVEQLLGLTDIDTNSKLVYRISDLASDFGVTLRSLRFYESRGLLNPERRGTRRLYSQDDYRRLRIILLCKLLGFSLFEIRQIVDSYLGAKSERRRALDLRVAFEQQRAVLQAQKDELEASMAALESSISALADPPADR